MIDLKGLNMNLVRLLAQARIVGEKELRGIVVYARSIAKLAEANPGEVFPQPIEETLGLWQAIALQAVSALEAKASEHPEPEQRTCDGCRYGWRGLALIDHERICVVDPPADKPRTCTSDRPACSRWEPRG